MKIWITGGNGFTGRNLTEYLQEKGVEVVATSRRDVNLYDRNEVAAFYKKGKFDFVIHCAVSNANLSGMVGESQSELHNNLTMFFNMAEAMPEKTRMIHFGSGAQYDKRRPLVQVREEQLGESIPYDDYGLSKFAMARYTETCPNILTLNIFGLYGRYENYRQKFISNAIVKKLMGIPIQINKDVRFDYLYITDFCQIVWHYLNHFSGGRCVNISTTDSILISEAAAMIDTELGGVPYTILNEGLNREYTGDNTLMLKDIPDFRFTSYADGIHDLIAYYSTIQDTLDVEAITHDDYLKRVQK